MDDTTTKLLALAAVGGVGFYLWKKGQKSSREKTLRETKYTGLDYNPRKTTPTSAEAGSSGY